MSPASGRKAAKRGFATQDYFIKLINEHADFNEHFKKATNMCGKISAKNAPTTTEKTDVVIEVVGGSAVGCSLKAAKANFNQLERVWLRDFAKDIDMPGDVQAAIQVCLDMRRMKKSKKFITDQYIDPIIKYFRENIADILNRLFTRYNSNVKYFIVHDYIAKKWYICEMSDVIAYLSQQPMFVSRGGVLCIGDCLSMQRKGGNGCHVRVPKSHPSHPGNQIQFKVKPLSIVKNIKSVIEI